MTVAMLQAQAFPVVSPALNVSSISSILNVWIFMFLGYSRSVNFIVKNNGTKI